MHQLTAFPKMKVSQRKPYVLLHIVCKVVLVIFSNFLYGMLRVVISGVVEKFPGFCLFWAEHKTRHVAMLLYRFA